MGFVQFIFFFLLLLFKKFYSIWTSSIVIACWKFRSCTHIHVQWDFCLGFCLMTTMQFCASSQVLGLGLCSVRFESLFWVFESSSEEMWPNVSITSVRTRDLKAECGLLWCTQETVSQKQPFFCSSPRGGISVTDFVYHYSRLWNLSIKW